MNLYKIILQTFYFDVNKFRFDSKILSVFYIIQLNFWVLYPKISLRFFKKIFVSKIFFFILGRLPFVVDSVIL